MSQASAGKVQELKDIYTRSKARKISLLLFGITATVGLAILAIYFGASNLGWKRVLLAVVDGIWPFYGIESDKLAYSVVWNLRFPRIASAIIAGAGLAVAGAVLQGITRNPLASPFTIGISAGAGFGATIAIVLGRSIMGGNAGTYLIVVNAFILSLVTAFIVLGISNLRGMTSETPILAGVAITYLLNAFASALKYLALEEQVAAVVHWLFGSLTSVTWKDVLPMGIIFIIATMLLLRYSWDLNAIGSGDETAASMGVNVKRVRQMTMLLAALITAGIICFTGVIGFVCLMAPHIGRMLVGGDYRFLLPGSCVIGALLLLGADTVGRTIFSPLEIPVGIVVSFIGVPFFFYLFMTQRRQYWA